MKTKGAKDGVSMHNGVGGDDTAANSGMTASGETDISALQMAGDEAVDLARRDDRGMPGGGLLGYAQFPRGPVNLDGVVIPQSAFGTSGTPPRRLTHPHGTGASWRHMDLRHNPPPLNYFQNSLPVSSPLCYSSPPR
jgi:hypothetical protein